jgi:alpha-mannosidase II
LKNSIVIYFRNSWSIDAFGQSPTMAYLLKKMGLENLLIQRVHYSVKKYLARSKNLEFRWRQLWGEVIKTIYIDTHTHGYFCDGTRQKAVPEVLFSEGHKPEWCSGTFFSWYWYN